MWATLINKGGFMNQEKIFFRLRIPEEMKNWLKEKSKKNRRSINGQILFYLDKAKELEKLETDSNEKNV